MLEAVSPAAARQKLVDAINARIRPSCLLLPPDGVPEHYSPAAARARSILLQAPAPPCPCPTPPPPPPPPHLATCWRPVPSVCLHSSRDALAAQARFLQEAAEIERLARTLREMAFMDEAMKRKMEEQETGEDNLGTWANYAPT